MATDKNRIAEIRRVLEQNEKRPISDHEVIQVNDFLVMIAEMALDVALIQLERKKRLEETPEGFHLDGDGPT